MFFGIDISAIIVSAIGVLFGGGCAWHYKAKNKKLLAEATSAENQARMDQIEANKLLSAHNKEVILDLKRENDEYREENRILKKQVSDLETKNYQLDKEVKVLQVENSSMKDKVKTLQNTVGKLDKKVDELTSYIIKVQAESKQ